MTIPKFLFHYYELDNGSFRNITEYGNEEAEKIQNKISKGWNSKRPENYIELRLALEKRIKEKLILKGGKPNRNDPFYFTLGECDWAKSWYVNPGVIKIPLTDFKPEQNILVLLIQIVWYHFSFMMSQNSQLTKGNNKTKIFFKGSGALCCGVKH